MQPQQLHWWKQFTGGDQLSFNRLFDHYWEQLFQYAYKICQSRPDAEETVQDLFVYLWEKRETLPEVASVEAYLFVALKNRLLNLLARKKYTLQPIEVLTGQAAEHTTEDLFAQKENEKIIRYLSAMLPEKMRYVYLQYQLEGRSVREIALDTQSSEQTVRNQLNTALKKLRASYNNLAILIILVPGITELLTPHAG